MKTDYKIIVCNKPDDNILLALEDYLTSCGYKKRGYKSKIRFTIKPRGDCKYVVIAEGKGDCWRRRIWEEVGGSNPLFELGNTFQDVKWFNLPREYNKLIGHFNRNFLDEGFPNSK